MAEFQEIMALRLDGKSYGEISAALGCSNRDIARVIDVIKAYDITAESFPGLSREFFDQHFPDGRRARKASYIQPDYKALADKLAKNKHLTRFLLWEKYYSSTAEPGMLRYQYTQIHLLRSETRRKTSPSRRFVYVRLDVEIQVG